MQKWLIVAALGAFFGPLAQADEALAKAKNCTTCHGIGNKIVGPGYKDIAAKRAGEKGAEAALAAKIKNGSKDEWGQVPMPPNLVTDAEASKLARWVLSFK
ncbi:c-type cytochrome [Azonexus sp.]|uniref:c-type cytochrome n=1 Tax=Azonexus sp. TaxID=1872668 RepID=UPI0039E4F9AA